MKLSLVHEEEKSASRDIVVNVESKIEKNLLKVDFQVITPAQFTNPELSKNDSVWGIWDWDVVEVFLSVDPSSSRYYEFILSPLNQYFELEIFEPRKRFNKEFRSGFRHSVVASALSWKANFEIPLQKLGWTGRLSDVKGGYFSILGPKNQRSYWSAFLPVQAKPDFHLPQYFKSLVESE